MAQKCQDLRSSVSAAVKLTSVAHLDWFQFWFYFPKHLLGTSGMRVAGCLIKVVSAFFNLFFFPLCLKGGYDFG